MIVTTQIAIITHKGIIKQIVSFCIMINKGISKVVYINRHIARMKSVLYGLKVISVLSAIRRTVSVK